MTPDPRPPVGNAFPSEALQLLAAAAPADKALLVLRLVEAHPEGRLELGASGDAGAALAEVDLSRDVLRAGRLPQAAAAPWWDDALQAPSLRKADLRGANLRRANFRGAPWKRRTSPGPIWPGPTCVRRS